MHQHTKHDHAHAHHHGSSYGKGEHYPNCRALTTEHLADCRCELRLYERAIAATVLCACILAAASFFSKSGALFGEMTHVVMDSLDSFISLAVILIAEKRRSEERTVRRFGAGIAFLLLAGTVAGILWWGIHRLTEQSVAIQPAIMLLGGVAALLLNVFVLGHTAHIHETVRSVNHAQLHFHALADVMIEAAVIGSAIAIWITGWNKLDAYVMLAIGAYLCCFMLPRAYRRIYQ